MDYPLNKMALITSGCDAARAHDDQQMALITSGCGAIRLISFFDPYVAQVLISLHKVSPWPTVWPTAAIIPMENPCCSCKLTAADLAAPVPRGSAGGLLLDSGECRLFRQHTWTIVPT